jgi:hypothetical protein
MTEWVCEELRVSKTAGSALLWQARHPFELQDQAQCHHGVIDVAAAGSIGDPIGNVAPGFLLAAIGRQMAEQAANIAQRA